jgi:hypothetical protein
MTMTDYSTRNGTSDDHAACVTLIDAMRRMCEEGDIEGAIRVANDVIADHGRWQLMLKACAVCGRVTEGRYCGQHQPPARSRWSPDRDGASHARFARAVRKAAQGRCEVCGSTDRVQAHHKISVAAGGTDHPDNGILLCNRELDPHAR